MDKHAQRCCVMSRHVRVNRRLLQGHGCALDQQTGGGNEFTDGKALKVAQSRTCICEVDIIGDDEHQGIQSWLHPSLGHGGVQPQTIGVKCAEGTDGFERTEFVKITPTVSTHGLSIHPIAEFKLNPFASRGCFNGFRGRKDGQRG